jgi:hypothetical protein
MKIVGIFCALVLSLAAFSFSARAQTTTGGDSGGSSTTTATPANPNAAKNAASSKAADTKKAKKVWTNDDVGSIKGNVSVVGDKDSDQAGSAKDSKTADTSGGGEDPKKARLQQYRDRIADLNAKIADADRKIAELKNFKADNGAPSGGINPNHGYNMVPLEEQVKQLEDKKKQMQASIEDVENQARKEGFDPGELRAQ